MSVKTPASWQAHALSTRPGMPSGPTALQMFTRLKDRVTSATERESGLTSSAAAVGAHSVWAVLLRFCKIMKANRMCFLPSQSLWIWARTSKTLWRLALQTNISINSEMSTFNWTNSNGKQIFSDYVICMKHAYRRIHYCGDDKSVSLFSAENKVYQ